MKLSIDISPDNAAFEVQPSKEVARILVGVADRLESEFDLARAVRQPPRMLYDCNGSRCGKVEVWP
jgi:hypothetical protein